MDKVTYLRELQAIPSPNARRAELLVFEGKTAAAEEVLLSNRMLWAAAELNLRLFNWERALAVAEQSGDDRMVSAVLWHRCAPSVQLAATDCPYCSLAKYWNARVKIQGRNTWNSQNILRYIPLNETQMVQYSARLQGSRSTLHQCLQCACVNGDAFCCTPSIAPMQQNEPVLGML
jgi:hypothetical protein